MKTRKTMNALLIERAIISHQLTSGDELVSNKDLVNQLGLDVPLISLGIVMKKLGFEGVSTPKGTFYLIQKLGE